MTTEQVQEVKKRKKRKHNPAAIRVRDLLVGTVYMTRLTGQLVQVISLDLQKGSVTYKALNTIKGSGSGRAAEAGETRTITNTQQWVAKLRAVPQMEVPPSDTVEP